jgi:energy-coupling factor transporter ATP-binding protein EcfA2
LAGSQFVRADLHVHSFSAANEAARPDDSMESITKAAKAHGISVLAITDHNSARRADEAAAAGDTDLLVLPGIEISTTDGHLIGLFAPDAVDRLHDLTRTDVLRLRDLAGGGQQSTRSMAELIDEIEARSGLAILAHIDTADGLLATTSAATLSNILTRPGLVGMEVTRLESATRFSDTDPEDVTKSSWKERQRILGAASPLARIMSSDAHSVEDVGVDEPSRTLTRLRLDELTFHAVRMALQMRPAARVILERDLQVNYPRAIRAGFTGGFLHDLVIDLSPNLTCLIGSRGSGKTTALRSIRACLEGRIEADEDAHPNMPDSTWVEFVDALGSTRTATRDRYQRSMDQSDGVSDISLSTIDLEQNFGAQFLEEDPDDPEATAEFLSQFIDTRALDIEEVAAESALSDNGASILATSNSSAELKKLVAEQLQLNRTLNAAADAKMVDLATYARILAAEAPMHRELREDVGRIAKAELPDVPDLDSVAAAFGVDLTERPIADFVVAIRSELSKVEAHVEAAEKAAQEDLSTQVAPVLEVLESWRERHNKWETEITARREKLKEAGLSLQVDQLDRIRLRLKSIEAELQKLKTLEEIHTAARKKRPELVSDLAHIRERRFVLREAVSDRLANALNAGSSSTVSIKWHRQGMIQAYGERLGQIFGLRSPRSERLASAVSPQTLAEIVWRNDSAALGSIRDGSEPFFVDAAVAMKAAYKYGIIFALEAFRVADRPEIRVRFDGDPPGAGRPLWDLSLGQARSILLGFLMSAPTNMPLILDQPEDQLDGPFLADTVVGYLHAAKERRQVIVATHNPNVVVLGDAELVLPLRGVSGRGELIDPGAVDNRATRAEVIRLLEGGMRAFKERAARYGLRVTDLPGA